MTAPRYVVKSGDTLWDIARATLGHGSEWPRLWRYNNRRDVIKVTGRGIPNPDLIYPGQVLLLPIVPGGQKGGGVQNPTPPARQPARTSQPPASSSKPGSLSSQLKDIDSPISFKFNLGELKFPPIETPAARLELSMTGDVVMMTRQRQSALYVTQSGGVELQVSQAANTALGTLVGETGLAYDDKTRSLTVSSMLVSQSTTPNAPSTAVGVVMNSQSPMPKLRFEVQYPKLEGSIGAFRYVAVDVKMVIELTPKATGSTPRAERLQPVRHTEPRVDWGRVAGIGLIVLGTGIVVGTLVEDFFTAGVGIADDPASFAAAGASFARGVALLRAGSVVLPTAATAASFKLTVRMLPAAAGALRLRAAGAW